MANHKVEKTEEVNELEMTEGEQPAAIAAAEAEAQESAATGLAVATSALVRGRRRLRRLLLAFRSRAYRYESSMPDAVKAPQDARPDISGLSRAAILGRARDAE
jgi:hypothetical protein